jgi:hypothetical protein
MTDPSLPGRLEWAAQRVDAILELDFWRPFRSGISLVGVATNLALSMALSPPDIWVGKAEEAHRADLADATETIVRARQQLEALADVLRAQARIAGDRIAREQAELARQQIEAAANPWPWTT